MVKVNNVAECQSHSYRCINYQRSFYNRFQVL